MFECLLSLFRKFSFHSYKTVTYIKKLSVELCPNSPFKRRSEDLKITSVNVNVISKHAFKKQIIYRDKLHI